jgi:hypothetical protein
MGMTKGTKQERREGRFRNNERGKWKKLIKGIIMDFEGN